MDSTPRQPVRVSFLSRQCIFHPLRSRSNLILTCIVVTPAAPADEKPADDTCAYILSIYNYYTDDKRTLHPVVAPPATDLIKSNFEVTVRTTLLQVSAAGR